jgi:hypothetical protein
LVESSAKIFDEVLLITWRQNLGSFDVFWKPFKNFQIILLDEEELPVKGNNTNKYRQVFTTLVGSNLMEGKGCTTVAKVRTDQSVSLGLLHAAVKSHKTHRPVSSLGVPYVNLFEIDRLADFYLVGNPALISTIMRNYLDSPEEFADTHKDYFYKFLNSAFKFKEGKTLALSQENKAALAFQAWSTHFYPLPSQLYKSMVWRSIKVSPRIERGLRLHTLFQGSDRVNQIFTINTNRILIKFRQIPFRLIKRLITVIYPIRRRIQPKRYIK